MDIASRLGCRLGSLLVGLGPVERVALLALALAAGGVIVGHLLPASDPILLAPFRWRYALV